MDERLSPEDYQARISERAQMLWEEAGRPEGMDEHFWFAARRAFDADHPGLTPLHAGEALPDAAPEVHLPMADNS